MCFKRGGDPIALERGDCIGERSRLWSIGVRPELRWQIISFDDSAVEQHE